jgi:hypothetical protein
MVRCHIGPMTDGRRPAAQAAAVDTDLEISCIPFAYRLAHRRGHDGIGIVWQRDPGLPFRVNRGKPVCPARRRVQAVGREIRLRWRGIPENACFPQYNEAVRWARPTRSRR